VLSELLLRVNPAALPLPEVWENQGIGVRES
jgi:hypothetical protein